jgi:hypothetical protein
VRDSLAHAPEPLQPVQLGACDDDEVGRFRCCHESVQRGSPCSSSSVHIALLVQVTQSLSTLVPLTPRGIGTEQGLVAYVFSGKWSSASLLSFSVGMKVHAHVRERRGGLRAYGFSAIALMLAMLRWKRALAHASPG